VKLKYKANSNEDEITEIDLTGMETYAPVLIKPGVYEIEYSFTDGDYGTRTATRNTVILWNAGDANLDLNVNSIDANWIKANYESLEATTDGERVFKYRVCDANRDGSVDAKDVTAINKRITKAIKEFYR
jgi:hypothetical protein